VWGGFSDWRLPDEYALESIVDYGRSTAPTIDTTAFPETPSSGFWSSSAQAGSVSEAWYVVFNYGHTYYGTKISTYHVRCVRRGP
jgi:hypothetical protein